MPVCLFCKCHAYNQESIVNNDEEILRLQREREREREREYNGKQTLIGIHYTSHSYFTFITA